MSAPYTARWRSRRADRARIVLAIILILFTALVGMLGAAPAVRGAGASAPAAEHLAGPDSPLLQPDKGA